MFSWPVFVFFPRAHRHTHHHMPFFREHSQSSDRLNMARILTQHTSFLFWSRLRTQSGGPPLGYHRDIVGVRHKLVRWCVYLFLWDSWTRFYCVISCNAFWGSQVVSCVWVPRCRRPTNPAGWTWCSPSDTHTHMSHDTHVWGHTLTVYTNEPLNDTMTAKIYRGLQNDVTWSYFNGTKKMQSQQFRLFDVWWVIVWLIMGQSWKNTWGLEGHCSICCQHLVKTWMETAGVKLEPPQRVKKWSQKASRTWRFRNILKQHAKAETF